MANPISPIHTIHRRRRPDCSRRAGMATASRYAHVIDGQRITTAQIASRLGKSIKTVQGRIRRMSGPLTWGKLGGSNGN